MDLSACIHTHKQFACWYVCGRQVGPPTSKIIESALICCNTAPKLRFEIQFTSSLRVWCGDGNPVLLLLIFVHGSGKGFWYFDATYCQVSSVGFCKLCVWIQNGLQPFCCWVSTLRHYQYVLRSQDQTIKITLASHLGKLIMWLCCINITLKFQKKRKKLTHSRTKNTVYHKHKRSGAKHRSKRLTQSERDG